MVLPKLQAFYRDDQHRLKRKKKVLLTLLVFCQIILACSAQNAIRIDEITPSNPLSNLDLGRIRYLKGLKVSGGNYPGTFVYSKEALTTEGAQQVGKFNFFKSDAVAAFTHAGTTSLVLVNPLPVVHAQFFDAARSKIVIRGVGTTFKTAMWQTIQYDAGTDTYTTVGDSNYYDGDQYLVQVGDLFYINYQPSVGGNYLTSWNPSAGLFQDYDLSQVITDWPDFPDSTAIVFGNWRVVMSRSGTVLLFRAASGIDLDKISLVTVADFKPRFATIDSSVTCDVNGCDVLVTESLTSPMSALVSKVRIGGLTTNTATVAKMFSADISPLGIVSKPVMIPNVPYFILGGTNAFHLYKIEASAFVKDNTFVSPTYTDMVDSSLAVGELNQSLYPDSVSIMALFKVASGPDKYNVKLFKAMKGCAVANCLTCGATANICATCEADYNYFMSFCTLCPASDPKNAIVVESNKPVCVDTSTPTYSSGYREVSGQTFRLIEKCSISGCGTCPNDKNICSACMPDHVTFMAACTLCPASDPKNAIVVEANTPKCVDATSSMYASGYREVTGLPFRLIEKCTLSGCATCPVNKDTCTACLPDHVSFMSACTLCAASDPKNAIVVENNLPPKCVDTSSAAYSSGYRDVAGESFRLIEKCTLEGCAQCVDDKSFCTACKTDYAWHLSVCTLCPTADPNNAIVVENSQPKCVDTSAPAFSTGYRDISGNSFRLIEKCTVDHCSQCATDKDVCTSCMTDYAWLLSVCTLCPVENPNNSMLVDEGVAKCIDTASPPYNSGYREVTGQSFRLIEKCTVSDCDTCPDNKDICTACTTDSLLFKTVCTYCPQTEHSALLAEDDLPPKCVDTSSAAYSSGYRDVAGESFRLIEKCTLQGCAQCTDDKTICTACKTDYAWHLSVCTLCPTADPNNAIIVENSKPRCVDLSSPAYALGYRVDTSQTSFKLLQACSISKCSTCPISSATCASCISPYVLSPDSLSCVLPASASGQSVLPAKLEFKVRYETPRNSLTIFQEQAAQLQITKVVAEDLQTQKTYSCEQIGCSYSTQNKKITFTFDSQIQILQGELRISVAPSTAEPTGASSINTGRQLQSIDREIVVPDFVLLKSNALSAWVTILQLFVWLLRTVGCVLVFPSHPRIAMLPDYTVTLCAVFSVFLGPTIPGFDTVVQAVAQTKILYFWFENPFYNWDSQTQSCKIRPGHQFAGVLCSFFDNYGQNTISFLSILVLILLFDWACKIFLKKGKPTGSVTLLLQKYEYNFGLKFWVAKLQANQLEILMYVLISYSLADSSSKSVVGLVLATLHLAFMVGTATLIPVLSARIAVNSAEPRQASPATMSERSLGLIKNLLGPSLCQLKQADYKKPAGLWYAILFARDLAFSILALNHIGDPLALAWIVAGVQLCYISYAGAFRYHQLLLEHIGLLIIDSVFLIMLLLKAVAVSSSMTAASRSETLAPILICMIAMMLASISVLFLLKLFSSKDSSKAKQDPPRVKLQVAVTEADVLLQEKRLDQSDKIPSELSPQDVKLYGLASTENYQYSIPQEFPMIQTSVQNHVLAGPEKSAAIGFAPELDLEVPWEQSQQEPRL